MQKEEFLKKLEERITQEQLNVGSKIHSYLYSPNEDLSDFALRALMQALEINASQVISLAIAEKIRFDVYPNTFQTITMLTGLQTVKEKINSARLLSETNEKG